MSSLTLTRARAATLAIPAWAWLTGLVALSAVVRYGFGRRVVAPWIMVDELIYSELAKSFAAGGGFLIRGEAFGGAYGVVYPILLSPAWALFDTIPDAYAAAKAINAVLISLAAVPAYLLARRVVSQTSALVVAGLTLALPSMLYAGTIMTENAFFPAFLAAVLALVLVLERPSPVRVVLLLALVGLAFATRAQAVALVPAALTAPLFLGRRVREFGWLYGLFAAAAVAVLAVRSPAELLGAYEAAGEGAYDVTEVLRWLLYHVAELDLSLWFLPFAALALVTIAVRPGERAFVAATLSVSGWLLLEVAAFASRHALRIEERNLFYVAPLFLVALLLWVERGLPRPPLPAALVAFGAAALPVAIPYERLIGVSAVSDTFGLLPWWEVHTWGLPLDLVWLAVLGAGAAAVAMLLLVPARWGLVLPGVVLLLFALSLSPVEERVRGASIGALFQGITNPERDWVDRAVGHEAVVAALWSGRSDDKTIFENEFFSRSVRDVYTLGSPLPSGLRQTPVAVDRGTGGLGFEARYVLVDDSVPLAGEVVARDRTKGMRVVETGGAVRVTHVVSGVYDDGWSAPSFSYRRFRCDGGAVLARFERDPNLYLGPQIVTVGRRRAVFPPGDTEASLRVPLGADCTARFRVLPTEVPGDGDTRSLGVRVTGFEYRR